LSGEPVPKKFHDCIETWKEKLSGYKFMFWDTAQFDINSTQWTKQAFEVELYACAADYIRLYAVYNHGGIYLDMDMEIIKPFDELLEQDIFLAYENTVNDSIEAGCFGAKKGHPFIKKCMEYFEGQIFFDPILLPEILKLKRFQRHEFINPTILPKIMSATLRNYPPSKEYTIFPYTYFTAKNSITGTIDTKEHSFTIHHYASSYHSRIWWTARHIKQKVFFYFGDKGLFVKILIYIISITQMLFDDGFQKTMRHYIFLTKRKIKRILKKET
jgi:hypothetical protein